MIRFTNHRAKAPRKGVFVRFLLVLCALAGGVQTYAANDNETEYRLENYLQLGPLAFDLPLFHNEADINGKAFGTDLLFDYAFFDKECAFDARPHAGDRFSWQGKTQAWQKRGADFQVSLPLLDSTHYAWVLDGFYLHSPNYAKATLKVAFSPAFKLYMDGVEVMSQPAAQDTAVPQAKTASLKIEPGYHVFVLKALYTGKEQNTALSVGLTSGEPGLRLGAGVEETYGLYHYLHATSVYAPRLSASGKYFKLSFNYAVPKQKKYASVHRIYRTSDLNPQEMIQPVMELEGISGLDFAEKTDQYAYMRKSGNHHRIYAGFLGSPARMVYETTEDLQGFSWDPQGRYMILHVATTGKAPENGLKHMENPMDQWPYYRTRTALSKLDLASGSCVPLTYGYHSASLMDISQDGRYLLFSTEDVADSMRQYMRQNVYRMDLQDMRAELLYQTYFPGSASFSPDAGRLLVTGSEQMFADPHTPGVSVPCEDCFITNDYEVNAFIFDIASKKAELITGGFGPSLQSGKWAAADCIYFYADDHDRVNLYAYRLSDKKFRQILAKTDVVNGFDVCDNALLYTGSSIDKPFRAYLAKGSAAKNDFASAKEGKNFWLVADPQGAQLKDVAIGEHHDWTFENAEGRAIEAVYYLPPDFDASKQYPCIVYYYSGTTPTPRALSMRYPKSVWASNGYVVLVLQPSGAIGYDRDFSAAHVNNWGITVADEIITGVRRFCREHAFVDSTKLGCIGASYGGFMTQLLVTRTDLFAAAISHAGISSISSYWGEGYWGYLYGAGANSFSFPWNRKDIFVNQSPLFNADKVHTPLLLLHGTSDVNVPIGESYQMYKALRLLGREVAMVTVAGEDHGIVDYAKRVDWEKTILAWFEKYLKEKPQWWEALYPAKKM
ncbi:MAG: prolyl oligopeptidase family serine peptidase [Bacteroides sp.]|nr:prolyl oligopeptidase family serine peptidase [Ruminococcus flavefaciens]MCM1554127.1 prolyl oligopeptidase family serine peptidase [Bacteroides sp.]